MSQVIKGGLYTANPGVELGVDPTHDALRASIRPLEHVYGQLIGGHYRATLSFSNTAAAAGPLASLRWNDTAHLFVLKRISVSGGISTVFTTAQVIDVVAQVARAFSVTDTGGTENAPILGNAQKQRAVNMNTSLLASLRSANTALTAGTRTLDPLPFGGAVINQTASNALGAGSTVDLYKLDAFGAHPVILGQNEGIVISPSTALGAAGVVKWQITFEWAEVTIY